MSRRPAKPITADSADQYCKETIANTAVPGKSEYLSPPKNRYQSDGWEFFTADLLENYGIRYMAPFDARDTKLPSGSIDVITTTSVFEHIPADACDGIIKEFRRIIHKDGLMSHTIDYSDHYAHADPNISDYNYLRYNNSQWKIFNPSIHYQNRLRTADYDKMFAANGFTIVEAGVWSGSEDDLNKVPISQTFKDMDRSALLELGCHYVVQPIADENPSSSNGLI